MQSIIKNNIRSSAGRFSWFHWHRRLGLITCIGILLWGISGITHPIMTHLQPKPAVFMPPAQVMDLQASLSPDAVLNAHDIQQFKRLGVVSLDGVSYFRVAVASDQAARYFATSDGQELLYGDRQYARMLASHYTGIAQVNITDARLITEFSDDYHAVNQLLPVWRVEFAGQQHLRAFIDTDQARLSALVDDTRLTLTKVFRFGHNWSFLDSMPRLQLCLMTLALSAALFSACSGLYLYIARRRHAKSRFVRQTTTDFSKPWPRRWHRRLGLIVAFSTLMFASSGLLHLITSYQQAQHSINRALPTMLTEQLSADTWCLLIHQPIRKLALTSLNGTPYWLLQNTGLKAQVAALAQEAHKETSQLAHQHEDMKQHQHDGHSTQLDKSAGSLLINATTVTAETTDLMTVATSQAAHYAQRPLTDITQTTLVTQFGGEYGFLFKRLPVVRVQFRGEGNPRYFIEPATGALSAVVKDSDALEGWVFAYIHKWSFADANKDFRDVLVALFALGNILVALMGVYLFSRKTRRWKSTEHVHFEKH